MSYCKVNMCKNNETCYLDRKVIVCDCVLGFTGQYCDEGINECASTPCQNGSKCLDLLNKYACTCVPG